MGCEQLKLINCCHTTAGNDKNVTTVLIGVEGLLDMQR